MKVNYYGFWDTKSKAYVNVFRETNDLTAFRYSEIKAQDINKSNKLLAVDLETHFLFCLDDETGKVSDNTLKTIFVFKDYLKQIDEAPVHEKA